MGLHMRWDSRRRLELFGGRLRSLRGRRRVGRCLTLCLCSGGSSGLGDLATFSKRSNVCNGVEESGRVRRRDW